MEWISTNRGEWENRAPICLVGRGKCDEFSNGIIIEDVWPLWSVWHTHWRQFFCICRRWLFTHIQCLFWQFSIMTNTLAMILNFAQSKRFDVVDTIYKSQPNRKPSTEMVNKLVAFFPCRKICTTVHWAKSTTKTRTQENGLKKKHVELN